MAKRRRLSAPDAAELKEIEEGFAAKPSASPFETKSVTPPIAQVAGEAARLSGMVSVTDRVALAQDQADAGRWRDASEAGLVAEMIPLDQIDADFIRRDRMVKDHDEMQELIASLRTSGLRTPIELTQTDEGYGLISGYRRLMAFRQLAELDPELSRIPAFVRSAGAGASAYLSMVEENEMRANLSHYERGRIAVLAAGQGVYPSVEAAVDALFATASKAKRSKVRSFAVVHEALGDLLQFPVALTEKAGLQLAGAVRDGAQARLRAALNGADAADARAEWVLLDAVLRAATGPTKDKSRGGRPQQVKRFTGPVLSSGGALSAEVTPTGVRIKLEGRALSEAEAERLMAVLARELD